MDDPVTLQDFVPPSRMMGFEQSPKITDLSKALLAFQKDIVSIKKTSENPFFKSKYASLPDILNAIKEPLIKAKLVVIQMPLGSDGLLTQVIHTESGQFMRASFSMTPSKNDPQGQGSALTYQRRYAIGAMLLLNTEQDDDGNAASGKEKSVAEKVDDIL